MKTCSVENDTTKAVCWSYPTSENANKFGFKAGCWTVETIHRYFPPVAIAGFATKQEAIAFADKLAHEWNALSLRFQNA